MADFKALLEKRSNEIEKPKPLPAGTYEGIITSHAMGESSQKKTPFVKFNVKPIAPGPDVDPALFEEFGGMAKLTSKSLSADFYITDDALWRLEEFLTQHCGIDAGERSLGERIPETTNLPIKFTVKQEPSQRGDEVFSKISGFAPATA